MPLKLKSKNCSRLLCMKSISLKAITCSMYTTSIVVNSEVKWSIDKSYKKIMADFMGLWKNALKNEV